MRAFQRPVILASLLCAFVSPAGARVLSYAPVTGRVAVPAVQDRTNRHYLLVETTATYGQRLVLYDSRAIEEPRDISPLGAESYISAAACWEDPGVVPRILAVSTASLGTGDNPEKSPRLLFSPDAGTTWKVVPVGAALGFYAPFIEDTGGRIVASRGSQIRLGPAQLPFVFVLRGTVPGSSDSLYVLGLDGTPRLLALASPGTSTLVGTDLAGFRFLLRSDSIQPAGGATSTGTVSTPGVSIVDLSGNVTKLFDFPSSASTFEGWITPFGDAYFDGIWSQPGGPATSYGLRLFKDGVLTEIASGAVSHLFGTPARDFLSVPTNDFAGAWIVQREPGLTRLSSHTPKSGLVEAWHDVAAPEIEAIHTSGFSPRLLIQVHRPRPQSDQRIFKDPALALWNVGDPAPKDYDELFLDEQFTKGFVHLDVETVGTGEPFVFNTGTVYFYPAGGGPSGGGGGGDVIQEWGVVRGSLRQRLVIPVAARTSGYFGSQWRTDVLVRNGDADPLQIAVRYVPNPGTAPSGWRDAAVTVAGGAILTLTDILGTLFDLEGGSGAVIFTPEAGRSLSATSRTYTTSAAGTYGMGVGAVDLHAAIGANFDITFAAGLLGAGFRTNLVATDVSGGGAAAELRLASAAGFGDDVPFAVPPGGAQAQLDGLAASLGVSEAASGSLLFSPRAGQTIAGLVAVDNQTNDPTYFPPDLPAHSVRTIPAIVHADGAFGAKFRTDLFLFNPSGSPATVTLAVKPWDTRQSESIATLTLASHESRVLRDVLFTLFGKDGVGRLRYTTTNSNDGLSGVRATSRTYTSDASGGTYGLLIPPLNEFQSAGPGESLEILGPTGGDAFRTNLALVELSAPFAGTPDPRVRIETLDEKGVLIDSFDTTVPLAGGVQLTDLFHGRGLGAGPKAALLRVTPFGGLVAAYATTTDNGTNDPVYFGASLVAK